MTFTHDGNISAVEVLYTHHDDPTYVLTLNGNPEPVEDSRITGQGKRSTVELTGVVDEALIVGRYDASRIAVYALSGSADPVLPQLIGEWPTLDITYGRPHVRDAMIELEPD